MNTEGLAGFERSPDRLENDQSFGDVLDQRDAAALGDSLDVVGGDRAVVRIGLVHARAQVSRSPTRCRPPISKLIPDVVTQNAAPFSGNSGMSGAKAIPRSK